MVTIDSHSHASTAWFEPVDVLLYQMDANGVDKTVLVQFKGQFDNRYLLDCARKHSGRFSIVGAVDPRQPDAPKELARWADEGLEGLVLFATDRSLGKDPLAIWRKAADLGIPVSCSGTTAQFASMEFRNLLEELPDLTVIIEHLGAHETLKFHSQGECPQPPYTVFRQVLELSRYSRVYVKLPPLSELMPRPMPAREPTFHMSDVPPVVDMAIDAFGAKRLMFAVDYPPVSTREGYANTWRYMRQYLSRSTPAEHEAIFGGTAASLFPFRI